MSYLPTFYLTVLYPIFCLAFSDGQCPIGKLSTYALNGCIYVIPLFTEEPPLKPRAGSLASKTCSASHYSDTFSLLPTRYRHLVLTLVATDRFFYYF